MLQRVDLLFPVVAGNTGIGECYRLHSTFQKYGNSLVEWSYCLKPRISHGLLEDELRMYVHRILKNLDP